MTHEDITKAMSTEQLAECLVDKTFYQSPSSANPTWADGFGKEHYNRNNAIACEVAWLKQEINNKKEDENN